MRHLSLCLLALLLLAPAETAHAKSALAQVSNLLNKSKKSLKSVRDSAEKQIAQLCKDLEQGADPVQISFDSYAVMTGVFQAALLQAQILADGISEIAAEAGLPKEAADFAFQEAVKSLQRFGDKEFKRLQKKAKKLQKKLNKLGTKFDVSGSNAPPAQLVADPTSAQNPVKPWVDTTIQSVGVISVGNAADLLVATTADPACPPIVKVEVNGQTFEVPVPGGSALALNTTTIQVADIGDAQNATVTLSVPVPGSTKQVVVDVRTVTLQ